MTGLVVMNEKNMKEDSRGLIWYIPAGTWWDGMRTMNIRIANQYSTSCLSDKSHSKHYWL